MEDRLSSILMGGERIDHWAHCTMGEEHVSEMRSSAQSVVGENYDYAGTMALGGLAVATNRRIFFQGLGLSLGFNRAAGLTECPNGSILFVDYRGGMRVRFVDVKSQVHLLGFREEADATQFVELISQHFGTAARRVSAEVRISAEWKLQHPIWDHRKNHGGESRKLVEIMDSDEHIEGLAWGDYHPEGAKDLLYGGIIAATWRRLLFVSDGLLERMSTSCLTMG